MFNNEHMADVHFIVGPPGATEKIPGHKVGLKSIKEKRPSGYVQVDQSVETDQNGTPHQT